MPYLQYLLGLVKYLVTFYKKTRPLEDIKEIEADFRSTFDEEWEQGSLFGWEQFIIKRVLGQG